MAPNELLTSLLAKLRDLDDGVSLPLTQAEAGALRAFLLSPEAQALAAVSGAEILDKAQVILDEHQAKEAQARAQSLSPEGLQHPGLLAAMGKLQHKQYDAITETEYEALRSRLEEVVEADESGEAPEADPLGEAKDYGSLSLLEGLLLPPESNKQVRYVESKDFFVGSKRKKVKSIAGIDTDLVVATYEIDGSIEINGDVPVDTLLIVRNGEAIVRGYVFGHVLSASGVRVTKNILGGWVIASTGNIEVDNILIGSRVIAEAGVITCRNIEAAAVVFAQRGLSIRENVRGGRLLGPTVTAGGTITSAEVHAVGPIVAKAVHTSSAGKAVVCLRREITCADYGRPFGEAYGPLKRSLTAGRYRRDLLTSHIKYTEKDVLNCYRSMLYFVLGGVDNRRTLCLLRGAQCLAIYLEQIMEAAMYFADFLKTCGQYSEPVDIGEIAPVADQCLHALEGLDVAVNSIPDEFGLAVKRSLERKIRQLINVSNKVNSLEDSGGASVYTDLLLRYLTDWWDELEEAKVESREFVESLGLNVDTGNRIERETDLLPDMLDAALHNDVSRISREHLSRINSGFMRLMQNVVYQHKASIEKWQRELLKLEGDLHSTMGSLQEQAHIISGADLAYGPCRVTAHHFDKGVIVTALPGPSVAGATDGAPTVRLASPISGQTTFRLHGTVIRRDTVERVSD